MTKRRRVSIEELKALGVLVPASKLTKRARRPRGEFEPFRVTDWPEWDEVYPMLQMLFGPDFVEVTKDNTILPTRELPWGGEVLDVLVRGVHRSGKRWTPRPGEATRLVRAYMAHLTVLGQRRGSVLDLRFIGFRIAEGTEAGITLLDVEQAIAGYAYLDIQSVVHRKRQLSPMFTGLGKCLHPPRLDRLKAAFSRGRNFGHLPADPGTLFCRVNRRWGRGEMFISLSSEELRPLLGP